MGATLLNKAALDASRRFIESTARPLELARFRYHFDGTSAVPILDALREYQNVDGGFGHALEPDLRARESSVLCTSVAFQVLRSIQASPDDAMVSAGQEYLLEKLDRAKGHWRIIPESAERSPHAPWWNQQAGADAFERFSLNPTAEVLGYLYDSRQHVPEGILTLVSDRVVGYLSALDKIEMHEILCCLRLLQTDSLPEKVRGPVRQELGRLVAGTVACDPAEWTGYSLRPLQVVDHPQSPFMPGLEAAVAANLDFEIASQNEDGSWSPTWSWGGAFPEVWEAACVEWSGILTLEKLLILKRFGRIEGVA